MKRAFFGFLLASTVAIAGCGGGAGGNAVPSALREFGNATPTPDSSRKIQHIVIVIQENRSFDNLFATFPGADGTTYGILHTGKRFKLIKGTLKGEELNHMRSGYLTECDLQPSGVCKMDGFDLIGFGSSGNGGPAGRYPLRYVNPADIAPYWAMAKDYALADHMFQTQGSGSFTAHQQLIAGGTAYSSTKSLIDFPSRGPWGCDAPRPTVTSYITTSGQFFFNRGPFPCMGYKTLANVLDPAGVSWKYYVPPLLTPGSSGFLWNAFDAIKSVRYGADWANVISPETNVFNDVAKNRLPAVSWVVPCGQNSDHAASTDTGPSWVAGIVNAIGKSHYWPTTAIIVVWDDWGGYYDHVPPAFIDDQGGLGFRVPMIVVSPYAKSVGYISHTQYEFGSILRFVEDNWSLERLGSTDVRATSIGDMFDFSKAPRKFTPISAPHYQTCPQGDPPDDA